MATFSVHARQRGPTGGYGEIKLVKDGFSFGALILGPLWFLAHRMWLAASLWLLGLAASFGFIALLDLQRSIGVAAAVVIVWLLALEASSLRRAALGRRGYRLVDIAEGSRRREAEISFLARHAALAAVTTPAEIRRASPPAEDVGLFLQGAN